jgi:hypothetical protein
VAALAAGASRGAAAAAEAPTSLTREEKITIDTEFTLDKNYWLSYQNIQRACYYVINKIIDGHTRCPTLSRAQVRTQACPSGKFLIQ